MELPIYLDKDLTLYKVENPADNLQFIKKDVEEEFDPTSFAVFKVHLEERADFMALNVRKTRHTSYVSTIKE